MTNQATGFTPESILRLESRAKDCFGIANDADDAVGTLYVVTCDQLPHWLDNQPAAWQAWVSGLKPEIDQVLPLPPVESGDPIIEAGKLPPQSWLAVLAPNTKRSTDSGSLDLSGCAVFAASHLPLAIPSQNFRLSCDASILPEVLQAWLMGSYQFTYFSSGKSLPRLLIKSDVFDTFTKSSAFLATVASWMVRDLINLPASVLTPATFEKICELVLKEVPEDKSKKGHYESIIGAELMARDYPLIYEVGKAASCQPRLIHFVTDSNQGPKLSLVGKGVCFDSGGLGIKAKSAMRLMKKDMGGAAHVLALAWWVLKSKLAVNLEVWLPLVENAIGPEAMKPGDIVRSRSGYQIEIDNTDAEGRLILADSLYAAAESTPDLLIDFATLTGAMRTALGTELPGFFSSQMETARGLLQSGEAVDDAVWQMPLHAPYREFYQSQVADFINCSSQTTGKAITAALFLQEFVEAGYASRSTANGESIKDYDWIHFDVMGYNIRSRKGRPVGGEAFGLRAACHYLQHRYGMPNSEQLTGPDQTGKD